MNEALGRPLDGTDVVVRLTVYTVVRDVALEIKPLTVPTRNVLGWGDGYHRDGIYNHATLYDVWLAANGVVKLVLVDADSVQAIERALGGAPRDVA